MKSITETCLKAGMTVVGIGSSLISFAVYGALDKISLILKDYCPYIYKYLPKISIIQQMFDVTKEKIIEGIMWIENNFKLTEHLKSILNSTKSFTKEVVVIEEVLEQAKKLDVVKSYCNDTINSLKISALSFGIISSLVTIIYITWNVRSFLKRKDYPPLLDPMYNQV